MSKHKATSRLKEVFEKSSRILATKPEGVNMKKESTEPLVHLVHDQGADQTACGWPTVKSSPWVLVTTNPVESTCHGCLDQAIRECVFKEDLEGAKAIYTKLDERIAQSLVNKGVAQT